MTREPDMSTILAFIKEVRKNATPNDDLCSVCNVIYTFSLRESCISVLQFGKNTLFV